MRYELEMPKGLEEKLSNLIMKFTKEAYEEVKRNSLSGEWMNLKEGANYAGVSYNTLVTFRQLGLKVCEINGVKRISKIEIDRFLQNNSY